METVYHIEEFMDPICQGMDVILETPWTIWMQRNKTIANNSQPVIPIYKFHTIAGFWTIMNNIKIPNDMRLIFMRDGISPKWEDPKYINGGYCMITYPHTQSLCPKISPNIKEDNNAYPLFMTCLLGVIGESFTNPTYDSSNITGIMYIDEPNFKQIRFWLSDINENLNDKNITDEYLQMFKNLDDNLTNIISTTSFDKLKNSDKYISKRSIEQRNRAPKTKYVRFNTNHNQYYPIERSVNKCHYPTRNIDKLQSWREKR